MKNIVDIIYVAMSKNTGEAITMQCCLRYVLVSDLV